MDSPQIGWCGLGSMGLPMASNLQKHLVSNLEQNLVYSNRTMSRGAPLEANGAIPEPSFEKLVGRCSIIFTMLPNDEVLEHMLSTAIFSGESLKDKIFIDCSTVHPNTVAAAEARLKEREATFLSAPVFGAKPIAAAAQLVFAIGGPRAARETVKPFIQNVMGRYIIDCGEDPKKSSLLKMAGNIVTISMKEIIGESQVFAERSGIGTRLMEELIVEGFGPFLGTYSKRLTTGIYAPPLDTRPGFSVDLAIKDANHTLSIARESNVELPDLEVARDNMVAARDYAGYCLDSSALYGILRQKAGLSFWNEKSRQGST